MVRTIEFEQSIQELIRPGTLVTNFQDSEYGRVVRIDISELTNQPQSFTILEEKQFPIPESTIAESQWRQMITQNRNLKIAQKIFEETTPPVLKFLGNAATLFLLKKHEGYQSWLDNIIKSIVDEVSYTHYKTKLRYMTLGVPSARVPTGRIPIETGSAYTGFAQKGYPDEAQAYNVSKLNAMSTLYENGRESDLAGGSTRPYKSRKFDLISD